MIGCYTQWPIHRHTNHIDTDVNFSMDADNTTTYARGLNYHRAIINTSDTPFGIWCGGV